MTASESVHLERLLFIYVDAECDSQMADPDPPAEGSQREQESVVPPADSSDPGLNSSAPSLDTELQTGGLGVQPASEQSLDPGLENPDSPGQEEEEGGADRAFTKPRPPQLHVRTGKTD